MASRDAKLQCCCCFRTTPQQTTQQQNKHTHTRSQTKTDVAQWAFQQKQRLTVSANPQPFEKVGVSVSLMQLLPNSRLVPSNIHSYLTVYIQNSLRYWMSTQFQATLRSAQRSLSLASQGHRPPFKAYLVLWILLGFQVSMYVCSSVCSMLRAKPFHDWHQIPWKSSSTYSQMTSESLPSSHHLSQHA